MIIADNSAEEHIRKVGTCVAAMAFLGTPQAGSDLTAWGEIGMRVTSLVKQTNNELVAVLKPGSEMLATIQRGFHNVLRRRIDDSKEISVTSFYEELPVTGLGEVLCGVFPLKSHFQLTQCRSFRSSQPFYHNTRVIQYMQITW